MVIVIVICLVLSLSLLVQQVSIPFGAVASMGLRRVFNPRIKSFLPRLDYGFDSKPRHWCFVLRKKVGHMGSIPIVLVAEIRLAFQACSKQHAVTRKTRFSTLRPLWKSSPPTKSKNSPIQVVHSQLKAERKPDVRPTIPPASALAESKKLVPHEEEDKSMDRGRKVEVPLKVIPKADIAPNLTLTPKERLHIEQLTRRLPPRAEPKGTLQYPRQGSTQVDCG